MSDYNKRRFAKKRRYETVSIYSDVCEGVILLDTLECEDNGKYDLIYGIVESVCAQQNERLRMFTFYFMQGYKLNEIAEKLSLAPMQASYLFRKLKKLCKQEYLQSEA